MKFIIEKKRIICFNTAWNDPEVNVISSNEVRVKFGGIIALKFNGVDEAMVVLNSIIRQIKGQMK